MSDEQQQPSPQHDPIDSAQTELVALKEQLAESQEKWKRALADYQNLERQTEEARARFVKIATMGFVEELIEPYDNLLLATKHIQEKGLAMVISQFRAVFERQGLCEINPIGKEFDPASMEGVGTAEGKENTVIEVMSVGYMLHDVLVRPAKVLVGKQSK